MRLRFSIRDLLWLTALVAMGIGWWVDHRALVGSSRVIPYQLRTADATIAANVLKTMFAGTPSVGISVDERNNSVLVLGNPEQQKFARTIIDKMEGKSSPGGTTPLPTQPKFLFPLRDDSR
jgi:hypothetical protein